MEVDVVVKHQAMNPCCAALKDKYSKLEATRNALRQGVKIQNELIDKLQNENLNLKKAHEEERVRAENGRQEIEKELAIRVSLENEVGALKSEILSLQQSGSSKAQDGDGEVVLLRTRLSEGETEVNMLKELVEKERVKAESESKMAEAERKEAKKAWKTVEAEKTRADKERRLADIERKNCEKNTVQLEKLKSEADEARSKLILEVSKVVEGNKKLEAERQKVVKEKKRADSEMAKAKEQRNLAEMNQKKAIDEKCRADNLSQQLEEHIQRIQKLQKEMVELVSSKNLVKMPARSDKDIKAEIAKGRSRSPLEEMLKREKDESKLVLEDLKSEKLNKRLEEEKQKVARERKRADSEMRKAEEHRKVAEANKKAATEEKHHADQLAQQLEDNRRRIEGLQKEILDLASSRTLVDATVVPRDVLVNSETAKMKLLKKQLKFKKKQMKHAEEVAKLEMGRNKILQQELQRLKQDFVQFSHHLDVLHSCFSYSSEGRDDLAETGNIFNTPSFNFKRELFTKEPHLANLHCNNDLVRPSCRALDSSDCRKQTMDCNAPLVPFTGGNCTRCISGIDSKMEPLLRGSKRKMLQSSAINSSTSSFSDRPLMGSQERGAFSVMESARVAEEKSNSQSNISNLSGEVTKTGYNKNLAAGAENSVRSPISFDAVGKKAGHTKKRKRFVDAVKSIENLYCQSKNWHLRIEEKLSTLHSILNSQMGESLQPERCMMSNLEGDPDAVQARAQKKRKASTEEVALQHLCGSNEQKDMRETRVGEEANVCTQSSLYITDISGKVQACKDVMGDCGGRNLASYLEIERNYMKLLDLDNAVDEECYRKAVEMPLSPTLPVIEFQNSETFDICNTKCLVDESSYEGFLGEVASQGASCKVDANVEIDSSKLKFCTSETSHVPTLQKNGGITDPFENLVNNGNGKPKSVYEDNAGTHRMQGSRAELGMPDTYGSSYECTGILCQSALVCARDDIPKYCVVFSDTKDCTSMSRIFRAIGTCMSQCTTISRADLVVQKILPTLSEIQDLLPKEKACAFFSVLLNHFSEFALEIFKKFQNSDSILLMQSIAGRMDTVVSDMQTRHMLAELCIFGELLTLIEDFLIDRRILVYSDMPSESLPLCSSRIDIHLNGKDVHLSYEMALMHQLVAGGIMLASICVAIDHIGFLCEASYNIFRLHKLDAFMVLTILHLFAYVCGSKYFHHKDYGLIMTVMKSLVTFLEKANLRSNSTSGLPSLSEVRPEFPACTKCPFSMDAVSVDVVASLLLQKLQFYAMSSIVHQDPNESVNSLDSEHLSSNEKAEKTWRIEGEFNLQPINCSASCCLIKMDMPATEIMSVCDGNFCQFSDVLSLLELVACNASWDWTCNNIVHQLLKFLESCAQENFFAVTVVLLGKLGRLGVDASGYEDNGVENLRCRLSAFLCQNSSRKLALPAQVATVNALLGLLSLDFEELIKSNVKLPAVVSPSNPADCIWEWYSSLSNEKQSLSFSLLQSAWVCSCTTINR